MLNEDLLNDLNSIEQQQVCQEDENEMKQIQISEQTLTASSLLGDDKFISHMEIVNKLIDTKIQKKTLKTDHNEQHIIDVCNQYAAQIDLQVKALVRFIKSVYKNRYPQLQGIVPYPAQYSKVVRDIQINNNNPIQQLKFPYLQARQTISIKMTISAKRDNLPIKDRTQLLQIADQVALLSEHHNTLMIYLQSCMQTIAPNLCQLLGSFTASKIISAAGGVNKLAVMPACNIQVLGGNRSAQLGLSQLQRNNTGYFGQMDVVKDAPKKFQMQITRMLATNSSKCARADMLRTNVTLGNKLREQMYHRFQKIQQQGGLIRTEKPMDIPDLQPQKKRGGKRYRKNKDLLAMSQLRKMQNRLKFGAEAEEEIGQQQVGLGMLKNSGGKLKLNIKKQKLNVSKGMTARMTAKSGMQSSLNLNSTRGIDLFDPAAKQSNTNQGTSSYFSKQLGFKTVLSNKFNTKT